MRELDFSCTQLLISSRRALAILVLSIVSLIPTNALGQQTNQALEVREEEEIMIESDRQSSDSMGAVFSAYGNVKITYLKRGIVASSRQAQYLKDEGIVILTGDVKLIREGGDSLYGQRVVYFLEDDRLVADSRTGSQVLLNLFFDTAKEHDGSSKL
ncbi:hypothetical protein [Prochlorococcus sp. MIT 1307]|uniref:LptA/OstA family protein n=1 Tax=Prochlorococcus sp. MIT 1307 TaxID=3096219 RepID=UPI002A75CBF2|nr:hypothetical protein [Prochlorococcus sp. MIT 1307]